jgi:hypothetical protein
MDEQSSNELKNYVQNELKSGTSELEIRKTLMEQGGWSNEDLNKFFQTKTEDITDSAQITSTTRENVTMSESTSSFSSKLPILISIGLFVLVGGGVSAYFLANNKTSEQELLVQPESEQKTSVENVSIEKLPAERYRALSISFSDSSIGGKIFTEPLTCAPISFVYPLPLTLEYDKSNLEPNSSFRVDAVLNSEDKFVLASTTADEGGRVKETIVLNYDISDTGVIYIKEHGTKMGGERYSRSGATYIYPSATDDYDSDGIPDVCDNCPDVAGTDLGDNDEDGYGNICDEFPNDPDNDKDGDGLGSDVDEFPFDYHNDIDKDGEPGFLDNCPFVYNPEQQDANYNGVGDVCTNDMFAHAIRPQTVGSGEKVTLSAALSRPTTVTPSWKQIGGPTVSLSAYNKDYVNFIAPKTDKEIVLEFELIVSEGGLKSDPHTTTVTVTP